MSAVISVSVFPGSDDRLDTSVRVTRITKAVAFEIVTKPFGSAGDTLSLLIHDDYTGENQESVETAIDLFAGQLYKAMNMLRSISSDMRESRLRGELEADKLLTSAGLAPRPGGYATPPFDAPAGAGDVVEADRG
jgi:hypothetical protein